MLHLKTFALAGAAAALILMAVGAPAQAQVSGGSGVSPPWATLTRCADMGDEDARLACFDAAMHAAGYTPKAENTVEAKHRRFGLSMPQIGILKRHGKEEGERAGGGEGAVTAEADKGKHGKRGAGPAQEQEDEIIVELTQVATVQPDERVILFTTDGGIWQQTDGVRPFPMPKEGDMITIHRSVLGGYTCDVNKYKSVRCKRIR